MSYIGPNELIFYNSEEDGIHSGGFSVNSVMMKNKISPIMTLNNNQQLGGSTNISDLFNDLVIPNWAFSSINNVTNIGGGKRNDDSDSDDSDSDDDDVIHDDLHNKLLELMDESVKRREKEIGGNKFKHTKKHNKTTNKKSRKNK
jgi:hypothetical protein